MPRTGWPSVVKTLSSGSSRPLQVTRPFSVIPQPGEMAQPSRARASRTSGRGIGAPAEMKTRSDERSWAAGTYVRSWRKGVAPMVKVTRSASMRRAAAAGFQTSSHTPVAPSTRVRQ